MTQVGVGRRSERPLRVGRQRAEGAPRLSANSLVHLGEFFRSSRRILSFISANSFVDLGEFFRSSRRIMSAISVNYVAHLGETSRAHHPSRARWPTRSRTADRPTSPSVHVAPRVLAPTAARAATQRQRHVALAAWAVVWAQRSAVRSPMGSRRSEGGRTRSSRSACSCIIKG